MNDDQQLDSAEIEDIETQEWLYSLDYVLNNTGNDQAIRTVAEEVTHYMHKFPLYEKVWS